MSVPHKYVERFICIPLHFISVTFIVAWCSHNFFNSTTFEWKIFESDRLNDAVRSFSPDRIDFASPKHHSHMDFNQKSIKKKSYIQVFQHIVHILKFYCPFKPNNCWCCWRFTLIFSHIWDTPHHQIYTQDCPTVDG